jgi:RNA polymerase sigma factor (sigma-70 family)
MTLAKTAKSPSGVDDAYSQLLTIVSPMLANLRFRLGLGLDSDAVESASLDGVMSAVHSFDRKKGMAIHLISLSVKRKIIGLRRRETALRRENGRCCSIYRPIIFNAESVEGLDKVDPVLIDILPEKDTQPKIEADEQDSLLWSMFKLILDEREATVLRMRSSGLSYTEIAVAIGVSRKIVGRVLDAARDKIRTSYPMLDPKSRDQNG